MSPLRLAFLLSPLLFLAPATFAQNSPSLVGAPLPSPNGFDKLFDAVERISPADIISTRFEKLTAAEAIQQKRNVVSRNKRALAALREALQLSVQHPPVRDADGDFGSYPGFRALADILDQEADVRVSNTDWNGAINSKLDCIELGVLMTRGGPLRAVLVGRDIEIIGRRGIDKLVTRLDKEQTQAAADRLTRIETLRPPFSDAIREGKIAAIAVTRHSINQLNWDEVVKETVSLDGQTFSDDERATLQTIGENEIVGGIDRTFNAALAAADAPYQIQTARVDDALDPWSKMLAGAVNSPSLRVDYEAARAQNRLFALALALRTERLRAGVYPETIETAPDPFAPSQMLKYRRAGEAYSLYSIGPNAKDDGGIGLVVPEDGRIPANASGDLVAPILPL